MNRLLVCACLLLTAFFFFFTGCASGDDQLTGRHDPAADDAAPVPGTTTPAGDVHSALTF